MTFLASNRTARCPWTLPAALTALLCTCSVAIGQETGGAYLWALENKETGRIERRGTKRFRPIFSRLLVRPSTTYRLWVLRRSDLGLGSVRFTTPPQTGAALPRVQIPRIAIQRQPRIDQDGDGLSDAAEVVAGSRVDLADTDGDGVGDAEEVRAGTNVNDGVASQLGVVAGVNGGGLAIDVRNDRAVLVSNAGLRVFNVYLALPPRNIGTVSLEKPPLARPTGVAQSGDYAAATLGTSGLRVVTLSELPEPKLRHVVQFPGWTSTSVVIADSLAFVSNGQGNDTRSVSELAVVDLLTGAILSRLPVATLNLRELALVRDNLVGVSNAGLFVFSIDPTPSLVGQAVLPSTPSARSLSVREGLAWVATGGSNDLRSFDLSTPSAPTESAVQLFPGAKDIALDAAGDLIFIQNSGLFRLELSDPPQVRDQFSGSRPEAIANYNGLTYVAGTTRFEVYSYLPPDVSGIAPTVSMSASFSLSTPQVEEGKLVRISLSSREEGPRGWRSERACDAQA